MDPVMVLLGGVVGLLYAMSGAGGGVLAVPLLVFFKHLSLQQAAPIALVGVLCSAALGAGLGLRERILRWRAALWMGALGALAAPGGFWLAQRVPTQPLMLVFALLMAFTAWKILKLAPAADAPAQAQTAPPCMRLESTGRLNWTAACAWALARTGSAAGFASGLLGVGGGFVVVPALQKRSNLDLRSIQATSLGVTALVALSGLGSAAVGGVLSFSAAQFGLGAATGLMLGRQIAARWPVARLAKMFAYLCLVVAVLMLFKAFG